jgi:hypothetical protein
MARGLQRMGTALRTAHNQDFEKKKKPELGESAVKDDDSDDDDDDDGEEQSGETSDRESAREIERVRSEVEIGMAGPAN